MADHLVIIKHSNKILTSKLSMKLIWEMSKINGVRKYSSILWTHQSTTMIWSTQ